MKILTVMLASAAIMAPASAYADDGWRLGIGGGTTLYSGDEDPQFASIALVRDFEQGYVEIGASMLRGGVTQGLINAVPAARPSPCRQAAVLATSALMAMSRQDSGGSNRKLFRAGGSRSTAMAAVLPSAAH